MCRNWAADAPGGGLGAVVHHAPAAARLRRRRWAPSVDLARARAACAGARRWPRYTTRPCWTSSSRQPACTACTMTPRWCARRQRWPPPPPAAAGTPPDCRGGNTGRYHAGGQAGRQLVEQVVGRLPGGGGCPTTALNSRPTPALPLAPPCPPCNKQVQRCTLLSIKTGGCPENCGYCSQSSHWSKETGTKAEKLLGLEEVYEVGGWVGVGLGGREGSCVCVSACMGCLGCGARLSHAKQPPSTADCLPSLLIACQAPCSALLCVPRLLQAALRAKASGSTRFCMGAAWRGPSQVGKGQWERVLEMVG